jgi:hypothetical protein
MHKHVRSIFHAEFNGVAGCLYFFLVVALRTAEDVAPTAELHCCMMKMHHFAMPKTRV